MASRRVGQRKSNLCCFIKKTSDDVDNYTDRTVKDINSLICIKSLVMIFNIFYLVNETTSFDFYFCLVIFLFSFFQIAGISLCVLGVYTIKSKHEYISLLSSSIYESSTYLIILIAGIIILASVLGFIGTSAASKKILIAVYFTS